LILAGWLRRTAFQEVLRKNSLKLDEVGRKPGNTGWELDIKIRHQY